MIDSFGEIQANFFRFEKPERYLNLCKPWQREFRAPLFESGIRALSLSYRDGWSAANLDFLLELPFIRTVRIWGWGQRPEPIDLSALSQCVWLERLTIDINSAFPDLSELTKLEILGLSPHDQNLPEQMHGASLRQLYVENALKTKALNLRELKRLNYIFFRENKVLKDVIVPEDIALEGLEVLSSPQLSNVKGLSGIKSQCAIWLGKSRKFELDRLPINTKTLSLASMGKIESLEFLDRYRGLEEVFLIGTTDIANGDLSVLLRLPKLRTANFADRKHYSHKRDEIMAALRSGAVRP